MNMFLVDAMKAFDKVPTKVFKWAMRTKVIPDVLLK